MALVGVQPTFTQVPPTWFRSMTAMRIPAALRRPASAGAAWPTPMMIASKVSLTSAMSFLPASPAQRHRIDRLIVRPGPARGFYLMVGLVPDGQHGGPVRKPSGAGQRRLR
jgi:hypothetical protein